MRCAQCKGQIERPGAICPHCGVALSGLDKLRARAKLDAPDQGARPFVKPANRPTGRLINFDAQVMEQFDRIKAFVLRDTKTTVISGMIAGAIAGAIIGFGWFLGALGGGFATFKYLEKK